MPKARYTLSKEQKVSFYNFLREVQFLDGYASNISRCVNLMEARHKAYNT